MKVIFLDVDGVINTAKKRNHLERVNKTIGWNYCYNNIFCKRSLNNLMEIVLMTDANIVISSARRYKQDLSQALKLQFIEYGLWDYTLSKTPVVDENLKHDAGKELEINAWMEEHKDIESFVILDDFIAVFDKLLPNVIEVNPHEGINMKVRLQAIEKLNEVNGGIDK